MKIAWVFPVSRVWRPYEHPRAHPSFFKKLAYSDKVGKLQLGKGSSPVSRPTNHTRRCIHSSFFQKCTWGILWNLHLVHNTIWFSVSTQNVRISSPQLCEFFFLPASCQSAGLQFFQKIEVTKISADRFLTSAPYKQPSILLELSV